MKNWSTTVPRIAGYFRGCQVSFFVVNLEVMRISINEYENFCDWSSMIWSRYECLNHENYFSDGHLKHFTKTCTHESNPLYSIQWSLSIVCGVNDRHVCWDNGWVQLAREHWVGLMGKFACTLVLPHAIQRKAIHLYDDNCAVHS